MAAQKLTLHTLPKPLRSTGCAGVGLKTVAPKEAPGEEWVAPVASYFAPGKVYAWDIDCGKVTAREVRSRLVGLFTANNDPPEALWSEDGGQLKTVLGQLFRDLLHCTCAFMPPGRPANNGFLDALNRILPAMRGRGRRRLAHATRAYNVKTKDRIGLAPETIWRAPRPPTSEWTNMAALDSRRKIAGAENTLDSPEERGALIPSTPQRTPSTPRTANWGTICNEWRSGRGAVNTGRSRVHRGTDGPDPEGYWGRSG